MSKNDKKTANKSANNAAEEPSKKIADQVIQLMKTVLGKRF